MLDTTHIPAPLEIYTERVRPEWIDHNGHMNVAYYLMAFDEAAGAVANQIGYTSKFRRANNIGTFIGDYHIRYVQEVVEGDLLRFTYRIISCDQKSFHYWQEMYHAEKGYLAAEAEAIALHIDMAVRKVTPFPKEIYNLLFAIYEAHKKLPTPANLGRQIKVRRHSSN